MSGWGAEADAAVRLLPGRGRRRHEELVPGRSAPAAGYPADAQAWLDRERANLAAVVVRCAGHGWPDHTARLAATLFRHLISGSHLPEALTIPRTKTTPTIVAGCGGAARPLGDPVSVDVANRRVPRLSFSCPAAASCPGYDYHDLRTGVLAATLAGRAPGYTSLGFPDPRLIYPTPSAME